MIATFGGRDAVAALAVFVSFGVQFSAASSPTFLHYVPGSPYCWPPLVMTPVPFHPAPLMPWALPTPAPPSGTEAPLPKQRGVPEILESRAPAAADSLRSSDSTSGSCNVGFWNVTGRDVSLTVGGTTRSLPKNRALTLSLPRQFQWQIEGRPPHQESVPAGQNVYEVILRPEVLPR